MKNALQIDYCRRWRPDFRYVDDKMDDVPLENWKQKEPSVTDKEAYRVTLASLRGQLAQGTGKIDVGSYSLKAGEEYNPNTDFSFLYRPDLTIVELDERIKFMNEQLSKYSGEILENAKADLAKAEQRRQELSKSENKIEKGESK